MSVASVTERGGDPLKRRITKRRVKTLSAQHLAPSAGALHELLPELANWITSALRVRGEDDLAEQVAPFRVCACWRGRLDNYTLSCTPGASRPLIWGDPDRRAMRLLPPRGVPRRQWQVGVVDVRGELLEIGVVKPSILRPDLERIGRVLTVQQRGEAFAATR